MAKALIVFIVLVAQMINSSAADCKKMPPRINPTNCCPIPEILTEENIMKCKDLLIPSPPSPTFKPMSNENPQTSKGIKLSPSPSNSPTSVVETIATPPMHWCFLNCAINDTSILQETGKLNEPNLSALLKKVLKDSPEFIPEMEKSFKSCSEKIEKFDAKIQENNKNLSMIYLEMQTKHHQPISMCSPTVSHLMSCVFRQTFLNCPTKYWLKSKKCSKYREYIKGCSPRDVNSMEDSDSHSVEEMI